ncbi:hypothetical protein YC2023_098225 [Brassica napus]
MSRQQQLVCFSSSIFPFNCEGIIITPRRVLFFRNNPFGRRSHPSHPIVGTSTLSRPSTQQPRFPGH